MDIYLGPWQLKTVDQDGDPTPGFWGPPDGIIGSLDLRAGPTLNTQGLGLFAFSAPVVLPDYHYLGQLEDNLSLVSKSALEVALNGHILSDKLQDALPEIWTALSDRDGAGAPRPLIPTIQMQVEMFLAGQLIYRRPFQRASDSHWSQVLEVLRADFARAKAEFEAIGSEHHRRVLGGILRKYRIPFSESSVIDPTVVPLSPETTLTESFPNAGNLDTTAQDIADWVVTLSSIDVVSGRAQSNDVNTNHLARANSNLSGDDHYVEGELWTGSDNSYVGMVTRHNTAAVDCYTMVTRNNASNYIHRYDAGTPTRLGSEGSNSSTDGNVIKLESNGSTHTSYDAGVQIQQETDTTHTGFTQGGIRFFPKGTGTNSETDNWKAEDLGAAVTRRRVGFGAGWGARR